MTVEFRILTTADELAVLPPFERFIWNFDDDQVGTGMLVAAVEEGGVAIAGYDGDALVATLFAFPSREHGVLHSHYMAVHPEYRNLGVGEAMKRRQAEWCVDNGYTSMRWTFDPLQLANAHLNLNKLGALGVHYAVNLYGTMGGINGSLPSDRLTVQWWLQRPRPAFAEAVVVHVPDASPEQISASAPEAFEARLALRDAMAVRLDDGWMVTAVDRAARTYTLSR